MVLTESRLTRSFAAKMVHLHCERASNGPEIACWGHRQRQRWWEQEFARRWEAARLAQARIWLAEEEAAWQAGGQPG